MTSRRCHLATFRVIRRVRAVVGTARQELLRACMDTLGFEVRPDHTVQHDAAPTLAGLTARPAAASRRHMGGSDLGWGPARSRSVGSLASASRGRHAGEASGRRPARAGRESTAGQNASMWVYFTMNPRPGVGASGVVKRCSFHTT